VTTTATALAVDADLSFSVEVGGRTMSGTLAGSGADLELTVDDPWLLGGSGTAAACALAEQLAASGLRVTVVADRPLAVLGEPRTSYWQRRVTGSRHIRVPSVAAALRLARLRRRPVSQTLVPPPTPVPLLPTFVRRPRRATTTHDADRGGYPRLVMAPPPAHFPGQTWPAFLLGDVTSFGSGPDADVVLEGLHELHAEVRRTEVDEFVVRLLSPTAPVRVNGAVVREDALLRSGTKLMLGPHLLVYAREEYADHGRPYGGRVGGELGRQRVQPPPPYQRSPAAG
jgi:hypothetical protein